MSLFVKNDGSSNYGGFGGPEMDASVAELMAEFDPLKRREMTVAILQNVLDQNAYTFVANLRMSLVSKAGVEGVGGHPCEYYLVWPDIDIDE